MTLDPSILCEVVEMIGLGLMALVLALAWGFILWALQQGFQDWSKP